MPSLRCRTTRDSLKNLSALMHWTAIGAGVVSTTITDITTTASTITTVTVITTVNVMVVAIITIILPTALAITVVTEDCIQLYL